MSVLTIWFWIPVLAIALAAAAAWWFRDRLTIRMRLIALSMAVGLGTLLAVGFLGIHHGRAALLAQQMANSESQLTMRKEAIRIYFDTIDRQVRTLAKSPQLHDASRQMRVAWRDMNAGARSDAAGTQQAADRVAAFFDRHYRPRLIDAGQAYRGSDEYLPEAPAGRVLQNWYFVENPNPVGEKHLLEAHPADADYNRAHGQIHGYLSAFLETFGYYDIFVVDRDGNIIYSVFKEADYATNLLSGPYRDSGIAAAFRGARHAAPGTTHLSDFRGYEPSYGAAASFIASPIHDGREILGTLIFQMPVSRINEIVADATGLGETGDIYLVAADGTLRSKPRFGEHTILDGISDADTAGANADADAAGVRLGRNLAGAEAVVARMPADLAGVSWTLISEIELAEVTAAARSLRRSILLAGIPIALVVCGVTFVVASALIRPIRQMARRFHDIASGDADLTQRVDDRRADELGQLGRGFNAFIERVHDLIVDAARVSTEVNSASAEIAATAEQMAGGLNEQRRQTTQISTGVEEMSATVVEVARQSAEANTAADKAGQQAGEGGAVVGQTVDAIHQIATVVAESAAAVESLGERAEQIGRVIDVINEIAEQTNLLALNAAIEAARAGEHGRGFAVVADEVRKLAERTTRATEEVAGSIRSIQTETDAAVRRMNTGNTRVEEGVACAREAGASLGEIVSGARAVAGLIQAIASATDEQSRAADDIARNVEAVAAVTSQSAEGADQMARAADQLAAKSEQLQHLIVVFRTDANAARTREQSAMETTA